MKPFTIISFVLALSLSANAQAILKNTGEKDKQFAAQELDKKFPVYKKVAQSIWGFAELGSCKSY
jgi:hypothetical protein